MSRFAHAAVLSAAILLAPTLAHAQATLTGIVVETSKTALSNVSVEVSGPALTDKVRTGTTDEKGQYGPSSKIPALSVAVAGTPEVSKSLHRGITPLTHDRLEHVLDLLHSEAIWPLQLVEQSGIGVTVAVAGVVSNVSPPRMGLGQVALLEINLADEKARV
jgi:hypothetical protein